MKTKPTANQTKGKRKIKSAKNVSSRRTLDSSLAPVEQIASSSTNTALLKPITKGGALWVSNGNGRVLTNTGRTLLALARDENGVAIGKLLAFAENEIEHEVFELI